MSRYQARISTNSNGIYGLIVRIEASGDEIVIHGYKPRFFASREAAEKSTSNYISKMRGEA